MRQKTASSLAAALAIVALTSTAAVAQNYVVDTFNDTVDIVPGDGLCQDANGRCSLRAAIMEANADAGIVNIGFSINGTFPLTRGGIDDSCVNGDLDVNPTAPLAELHIVGSGPGSVVIDASTLPPGQPDRVLHVPAAAPAGLLVELVGITLQSGRASGATGTNGGGALIQGGRLQVVGVEVRDCFATSDGGGIWSSRQITSSAAGLLSLFQNTAGDDAGGMYLDAGGSFSGLLFAEGNQSNNRGGALRVSPGAAANIPDATVQLNNAVQGGGLATSGPVVIGRLTAIRNNAVGGGNGGAAAVQNGGSLSLGTGSTLVDNSAANAGGAVNIQFGGSLTVDATAFRNNVATALGGAIANAGTVEVKHSEFSGNRSDGSIASALGGGAVYNQNPAGVVRAVNCTFSGNRAPLGYGGAIYNDFDARVELSASTVAGNLGAIGHSLCNGNSLGTTPVMQVLGSILDSAPAPPGNNVAALSPVASAGFNINVDGTGMLPAPADQFGTIATPINPLLTPLIPCGPTQVRAPLAGSPAIDRGACFDLAGNILVDDECLLPRPTDGDGNGIAQCDVGAVEAPPAPTLCTTCRGDMNGDNRVDGADVQQYVACILAGPAPVVAPGCGCADMDADGLLDLSIDLDLFIRKVVGIGDPNPACP
ncbi:MAG: choice-of-anchor Q domain-containing protein [Phycisphaerae bacterium]